ncbi:MAG: retron St85 family effector protein [Treponema sp.]
MEKIDEYIIIKKLINFLKANYLGKDISLFLCGGAAAQQAKFRYSLGKKISDLKSKYIYSIYYPETLFMELLLGHNATDSLRLENYLAESVNAIVIPLQSPGTFTELGAFSNHHLLKDKLIVIIDPKYKLKNSFINSGPIKLLKEETQSQIIYSEMNLTTINQLSYDITEAARTIVKVQPLSISFDNIVSSQLLYLCIVYIFDPVDIDLFRTIIKYVNQGNILPYKEETILANITRQGNIKVIENKKLTFAENGFNITLQKNGFNNKHIKDLLLKLSEYRVDALNVYFRKKGVNFGGNRYYSV